MTTSFLATTVQPDSDIQNWNLKTKGNILPLYHFYQLHLCCCSLNHNFKSLTTPHTRIVVKEQMCDNRENPVNIIIHKSMIQVYNR